MKELKESRLEVSPALLDFVLAGNATFTIRSVKTSARYTYRVRKHEERNNWFVSLLTGSDNESDYRYLGMITDRHAFKTTRASAYDMTATPVTAFAWFIHKLANRADVSGIEFFHAGKCGRCGRTLTVPESLKNGLGPECAERVGIAA